MACIIIKLSKDHHKTIGKGIQISYDYGQLPAFCGINHVYNFGLHILCEKELKQRESYNYIISKPVKNLEGDYIRSYIMKRFLGGNDTPVIITDVTLDEDGYLDSEFNWTEELINLRPGNLVKQFFKGTCRVPNGITMNFATLYINPNSGNEVSIGIFQSLEVLKDYKLEKI